MPVEVLRGFEQTFGCMILEGYGLSDLPGRILQPPGRVRKPVDRNAGRGVEMCVVDLNGHELLPAGEAGEIAIRAQRDEGLLGQARGHR